MRVRVNTLNRTVATVTVQVKSAVTVGIQGPPGISSGYSLADLADVESSGLVDGAVLVYNASTQKWTVQRILDKQIIDAGDASF